MSETVFVGSLCRCATLEIEGNRDDHDHQDHREDRH